MDATEANSTATFRLTAPRKGHSLTAKNSKTIRIRSASYDGASHTVVLDPIAPFTLRQPVQLTVYGTGPSALQDGETAGPSTATATAKRAANAVATLSRGDETIVVTPNTGFSEKDGDKTRCPNVYLKNPLAIRLTVTEDRPAMALSAGRHVDIE